MSTGASRKASVCRLTRWTVLRFVAASLIGIAATIKAIDSKAILAGDGLLGSPLTLYPTIGVEAMLAAYLVSGSREGTWRASIATFAVFSAVSAYAVITEQDCNCISSHFGPKILLPVDLLFLVLTLWARPQDVSSPKSFFADTESKRFRASRTLMQWCGCAFVSCLAVGVAVLNNRTESAGFDSNHQDIDFLLAEDSIGKRWPLGRDASPELADIEAGQWLVLIVRVDCQHCRELLSEYFSDPTRHPLASRTAIFVAGDSRWEFQLDAVSLDFDPLGTIDWSNGEPFVASPAIFVVDNGQVVAAGDGRDSDDLLRLAFQEETVEEEKLRTFRRCGLAAMTWSGSR